MDRLIFKPFDTPEDYAIAPPLKFPWRTRYHDYTKTDASFRCGCGERLEDVRGYTVDGQEMIELAVAGVCPPLPPDRARDHDVQPLQGLGASAQGWRSVEGAGV